MQPRRLVTPCFFISVVLLSLGCGGASPRGIEVYEQPLAGGNTFTCATCHSLDEQPPDGLRRPGHPIGDATRRASFKNGQIDSLLAAANTCVTEWMGAEPWTDDSPEWLALYEFLDGQTVTNPPVEIQIVSPPAELGGGDVEEGRALFNGSCTVCHGNDAVGTDQAPPLAGEFLTAELIAERVRLSGSRSSQTYEGLTGGRMPFWGANRLSDDELVDLVAFVLQNDPEVTSGGTPVGAMDRECEATHPKVGYTATLSPKSHGVSGTARIVDDCTIVIDDFFYDGLGIDVRIYTGEGGNYDDGISISGDLRRSDPYAGETLTVTLPEPLTFDDFDGISVWCVPVGTSFGDGIFMAP